LFVIANERSECGNLITYSVLTILPAII